MRERDRKETRRAMRRGYNILVLVKIDGECILQLVTHLDQRFHDGRVHEAAEKEEIGGVEAA